MKVNSQVACLTLIIAVLLVGCSDTAATPAVVDTVVGPPESPTSLPPSATQPPPTTTQLPTDTLPPASPTLPPPTDTPPPTTAATTPVSSPVPTLVNLPVEGVWTGGGRDLLVDFVIQTSDSQATVSNVGILWEGREECDLNARLEVEVLLDESGFVLNYYADEFSVVISGNPASNSLITGIANIKVDECGSHQINWQAVPKTSTVQ